METMTVTSTDQFAASPLATSVWRVDPARSSAEFSVGNRLLFVKFTVGGHFSDIGGTITLDEGDLTRSRADLVIRTASVDTGIGMRDKHLKAADYFDVERYPDMTFTSRRIEAIDAAAGHYWVVGSLTLRGVTRPISLDVRYTPARPGAGVRRIGLTGTTTISRRDFGIEHQRLIGGPADEVRVSVAIEATPAA